MAYLSRAWFLSAAVYAYLILRASVLAQAISSLAVPETTAVRLISAVVVAWALTNFGVGVVIDR